MMATPAQNLNLGTPAAGGGVNVNVFERQLATAQQSRDTLKSRGNLAYGLQPGLVPAITLEGAGLIDNPELLFQVELLNLGAELEASGFLDFAMGEGMAGPCGWGSDGGGNAAEQLAKLLDPSNLPGKTGYVGDRVNSIWSAINRSLFRARLQFQTSDQSTPETDDPLFRDSRTLPRTLSLRKLRRQ